MKRDRIHTDERRQTLRRRILFVALAGLLAGSPGCSLERLVAPMLRADNPQEEADRLADRLATRTPWPTYTPPAGAPATAAQAPATAAPAAPGQAPADAGAPAVAGAFLPPTQATSEFEPPMAEDTPSPLPADDTSLLPDEGPSEFEPPLVEDTPPPLLADDTPWLPDEGPSEFEPPMVEDTPPPPTSAPVRSFAAPPAPAAPPTATPAPAYAYEVAEFYLAPTTNPFLTGYIAVVNAQEIPIGGVKAVGRFEPGGLVHESPLSQWFFEGHSAPGPAVKDSSVKFEPGGIQKGTWFIHLEDEGGTRLSDEVGVETDPERPEWFYIKFQQPGSGAPQPTAPISPVR
jgi:hypothetical protein